MDQTIRLHVQDLLAHYVDVIDQDRLEEWPENQSTAYFIQGARIGAEFTNGIVFPQQMFFTSRPGLRYFGEGFGNLAYKLV